MGPLTHGEMPVNTMNPRDKTHIIFPLESFSVDGFIVGSEGVELSPEVRFRESTDEERNIGEQCTGNSGFPPFSYVLEETTHHPRTGKPCRWAITALRLLHEGGVGYRVYIRRQDRRGHLLSTMSCNAPNYILKSEEIPSLKELYSATERAYSDPLLHLALKRFNISHGKDLEDQIIDLVICLEMLFLKRESPKGKTLARRVNKFLSNDFHSHDLVEELYKVRSEIVHEGADIRKAAEAWLAQNSSKNASSFVAEAQEITRSCLRKFVLECFHGKVSGLEMKDRLLY